MLFLYVEVGCCCSDQIFDVDTNHSEDGLIDDMMIGYIDYSY